MPRMDGLTFLKKLMHYFPLPVIIVSSLTPKGSQMALEAMDLGAVEVLAKPGSAYTVGDLGVQLIEKIRAAAQIRYLKSVNKNNNSEPPGTPSRPDPNFPEDHRHRRLHRGHGGHQRGPATPPSNCPGLVIVQHMPPKFTTAFAARLDGICDIEVKEAQDGDSVLTGRALIAPGAYHMLLRRSGARYYVQVKDGPLVHHQRPSVDCSSIPPPKARGPMPSGSS